MGKKKELKQSVFELNELLDESEGAREVLFKENEGLKENNAFLRKEGKAACSKIENLRTIIDGLMEEKRGIENQLKTRDGYDLIKGARLRELLVIEKRYNSIQAGNDHFKRKWATFTFLNAGGPIKCTIHKKKEDTVKDAGDVVDFMCKAIKVSNEDLKKLSDAAVKAELEKLRETINIPFKWWRLKEFVHVDIELDGKKYEGRAECSPSDTFNLEKGMLIALKRAWRKYKDSKVVNNFKQNPQPAKINGVCPDCKHFDLGMFCEPCWSCVEGRNFEHQPKVPTEPGVYSARFNEGGKECLIRVENDIKYYAKGESTGDTWLESGFMIDEYIFGPKIVFPEVG